MATGTPGLGRGDKVLETNPYGIGNNERANQTCALKAVGEFPSRISQEKISLGQGSYRQPRTLMGRL
jgi:hypothetical protein